MGGPALEKLITELSGVTNLMNAGNVKVPDAIAALKEIQSRLTAVEAYVSPMLPPKAKAT